MRFKFRNGIAGLSLLALAGCISSQNASYEDTKQVEVAPVVRFPQERILPITLTEYCANQGTKPSDYDLVGLASYQAGRVLNLDGNNLECNRQKLLGNFVPENTEVVVNYTFSLAGTETRAHLYESGVALVPKSQ